MDKKLLGVPSRIKGVYEFPCQVQLSKQVKIKKKQEYDPEYDHIRPKKYSSKSRSPELQREFD